MKTNLKNVLVALSLLFVFQQAGYTQSLDCQDSTGRKLTVNGVTSCPFGLTPYQESTKSSKPAQSPSVSTPKQASPAQSTVTPKNNPVAIPKDLPAPVASQPVNTEKLLFIQKNKAEISDIQRTLDSLGFKITNLNGVVDAETEKAIRNWQSSKKRTQTGFLSDSEVSMLYQQGTDASKNPAPTQSALVKKYSPVLGIKIAEDVLTGNNRDLVFFFNETETAPNGVRGLSGNVSFTRDRVNLCLLQGSSPSDTFIDWMKIDWVRKEKTVQNFELRLKECPPITDTNRSLAAFDIYGVERRLLTNSANTETALFLNLVQLLQSKKLSYYTTSEYVPFEVYEESRRAEAIKNLRLLKEGKMEGFGAVLVNSNTNLVCTSTTEDPTLLAAITEQTVESFTEPKIRGKKNLEIRQEVPEAVFISAKRKSCGFLVGDADFLKTIVLALERDGVNVSMAPLWLKQEKVDTLLKDLETKKRLAQIREKEDEAQREREKTEERQTEEAIKIEKERQLKLAAAKQSLESQEKQEELKRLRKLVESRGQSIVDDWNKKLRSQIASITKEIQDIKNPIAQKKLAEQDPVVVSTLRKKERLDDSWTPFTNWQISMAKEGWEFGDTKASLEDYGLAKWRSRMIETVVVRSEFPMTNRVIGERRTACWNFIWINDEEFSFQRQPLAVPCEKYDSLFRDWAVANQFKSQWKM